jgi:hypothetical protein
MSSKAKKEKGRRKDILSKAKKKPKKKKDKTP